MTFSPLCGAGPLCLGPGLGRGPVLSANIFRAYGFLSSSMVEVGSLAPGFCSACYFPHSKLPRETFSFSFTWGCSGKPGTIATVGSAMMSLKWDPRSMVASLWRSRACALWPRGQQDALHFESQGRDLAVAAPDLAPKKILLYTV